jgi:peptide chain release factor 3
MALEQERGISITSTVLQFEYERPAHQRCSTRRATRTSARTPTARCRADSAVMVLDAAKGIEPQTRKLFEVCRMRTDPDHLLHQQARSSGPRSVRAARRDREELASPRCR